MTREPDQIELDIHPDPNRLDEEWVGQPRLRFRYGQELAEARRTLAQAKAELDVVEAELSLRVRAKPDEYDLEKVTEAVVSATVEVQPKRKRARQAVVDAQHEVDVLDAAVSAIDHRKKALEDLVQLHLAGYFATPRAPAGVKDEVDSMSQRTTWRRGTKQRGG